MKADECKEWGDKALALASYARQADDKSLEDLAKKIRALAVRRAGELFNEITPGKGGRPSEKPTDAGPVVSEPTRKQAADQAGMSEDQRLDAQNVAKIPEAEFDAKINSDNPSTIKGLLEDEKKKKTEEKPKKSEVDLGGRTPADFMRVAGAFGGKSEIISHLTPTALYELAAPSTPETVIEEVEALTIDGKSVSAADIKKMKEAVKAEADRADETIEILRKAVEKMETAESKAQAELREKLNKVTSELHDSNAAFVKLGDGDFEKGKEIFKAFIIAGMGPKEKKRRTSRSGNPRKT